MLYSSPIGPLRITVREGYISEILFCDETVKKEATPSGLTARDKRVIRECTRQLDEYFKGTRREFDFPMKQQGTAFQQQVWDALMHIPYGTTTSYLKLAQRIGNEKSIRAVGTANGSNNLPIVVPCHRVIGSNGSLTGYGGGLWRKQWLLEHENKFAHGVHLLF